MLAVAAGAERMTQAMRSLEAAFLIGVEGVSGGARPTHRSMGCSYEKTNAPRFLSTRCTRRAHLGMVASSCTLMR